MEIASHTHMTILVLKSMNLLGVLSLKNIKRIVAGTPATQTELISFAWPCGHTTTREQVIAADNIFSQLGLTSMR